MGISEMNRIHFKLSLFAYFALLRSVLIQIFLAHFARKKGGKVVRFSAKARKTNDIYPFCSSEASTI
jgi:hypothetical protein